MPAQLCCKVKGRGSAAEHLVEHPGKCRLPDFKALERRTFWRLWTEGASDQDAASIAVAAKAAQEIAIAAFNDGTGGLRSGGVIDPFVLHNGKDVGG